MFYSEWRASLYGCVTNRWPRATDTRMETSTASKETPGHVLLSKCLLKKSWTHSHKVARHSNNSVTSHTEENSM